MAVTRQRELVETVDLARERLAFRPQPNHLAFHASTPVALTCSASAGFKLQKNAAIFSAPGSGLPIGSTPIITLALSYRCSRACSSKPSPCQPSDAQNAP